MQKITIYRGLLLSGDSGAGKSSMINAGLVPAAQELNVAADRLLVQPKIGSEIVLERIPATEEEGPPFLLPSLAIEEDTMLRVPLSIQELEQRVAQRASDLTWLLVFDQFEEIVTQFPRESAAQRDVIVRLLVRLFYAREFRVKLLLAFREDYLAKIMDLLADAPELIGQYFWLRPPMKERALEIIEGPFDTDKHEQLFDRGKFDREITKDIADQLSRQGDADRLSLTDLQVACLELWRARDPARLLAEIGVQGLIELYLNRTLDGLSEWMFKQAAIVLLGFMVTRDGTRNIISEADAISRLLAQEGFTAQLGHDALNALVLMRLVRRDMQHDAAYYDIVSEFLIPWISRKRREYDMRMQLSAVASLTAAANIAGLTSQKELKQIVETVQRSVPTRDSLGGAAIATHQQQGSISGGRADSPNRQRQILWVDDRPDNNIHERNALEAMGLRFTLALSTDEALRHLAKSTFAAIISDMGRREGPREGYVLLDAMRKTDKRTPFFFYAASSSPRHKKETEEHGGQGCTNNPQELFRMIIDGVRQNEGETTPTARMVAALRVGNFRWRSIYRLAVIGGLRDEHEALELLRAHPDVVLSISRSGRRIARYRYR
jgi:CheY-like chemotaxis protein